MHATIYVKLDPTAGIDSGPYDVYTDLDLVLPILTDVPRSLFTTLEGFELQQIDDAATSIVLVSKSDCCTNTTYISIVDNTTTTTTSTTTSTTTAVPTTTSTTTSTTTIPGPTTTSTTSTTTTSLTPTTTTTSTTTTSTTAGTVYILSNVSCGGDATFYVLGDISPTVGKFYKPTSVFEPYFNGSRCFECTGTMMATPDAVDLVFGTQYNDCTCAIPTTTTTTTSTTTTTTTIATYDLQILMKEEATTTDLSDLFYKVDSGAYSSVTSISNTTSYALQYTITGLSGGEVIRIYTERQLTNAGNTFGADTVNTVGSSGYCSADSGATGYYEITMPANNTNVYVNMQVSAGVLVVC